MPGSIDYYYSTPSIYSYLGAERIVALARAAGRTLVHKPVNLDRVVPASAVARGVFGSPTYIVDGDMFYRQDRLMVVERALRHAFKPAGLTLMC